MILFPCHIVMLLCWTMIGMGFMAGARSPVLRGVLAALCVFFMIDLYVFAALTHNLVWSSLVDRPWEDDPDARLGKIFFWYTIWQLACLAFMVLLAAMFFAMGAAVMRRSRYRKWSTKGLFLGAGLLAAVGSLILAFIVEISTTGHVPSILLIVPWVILVFLPPSAMFVVRLHDRRHRNLSEKP